MSKKVSNELVQSIGNSWIVCRSKSYADRIYYFNTLTGKSVWNLSEPEMEKAKRTTHFLGKSSNFLIDNCPEPSNSPTDYEHGNIDIKNQHNVRPSKRPQVYNEQIINKQFPRAPLSNFQPMNPMQQGIPVSQMYNPRVWNIPPQPVLITPIDQADSVTPTVNVSETIPVSKTLIPLSSRFKSLSNINNSKLSSLNTINSREILNDRLNAVNSECNDKNKIFKTKCDLREILSARRKKSVGGFQSMIGDGSVSKSLNSEHNYVPLYMRDEEWLLENFQSNRYNLNTSELRKLVNLDSNTDLGIVTDTNVLLNNSNFLTVLLHSDKLCNLIVPYPVLEEIQRAAKSNSQAQKALYFISQQINLKKVVIDNERLGERGLAIEDEILDCCSRLSEQGILFVLFTNNIEILDIKGKVMFPILTIREVKMLSCHQFHLRTHTFSSPIEVKEASIKITIPNEPQVPCDTSPKNDDISNIVSDNCIREDTPGLSNIDRVEEAKISAEIALCEPNKKENVTESITANTNNSSIITPKKYKTLKRNFSNDTSASIEVKNFKWRRKKARTDNWSETGNESNTTNFIDSVDYNSNQSQICECKESEIVCVTDGSNIVNNETLVPSYSPKAVNLNSSILPTLNLSNIEQTDPKKPESSKEEKNVMFEISSKSMEDNLRTKCDEWVSRFTQIMEEVLTEVLHKEPKFVCEAMPPPWSLYEAAECTRRKFHSDGDVVDATNKFCNILFDIGASRGKVKSNISPQQYMDLYSYGVYLTDALQGVLNDCEDLQTASELLARLLKDIQDPHLDLQNQNSFSECIFSNAANEESEKVMDIIINKNERIEQGNEEEKREKQFTDIEKLNVYRLEEIPQNSATSDECPANSKIFKTPKNCKQNSESFTSPLRYNKNNEVIISPSKYNLRSNKRSSDQEIAKLADTKSSFFNSLHLIKRTISGIDVNKSKEELNTEDLSPRDKNANEPLVENNDKNKVNSNTNVNEERIIEPKVVRNFVKCLDFEERLQNKYSFLNYDDQENEESDFADEAYYDGMVEGYQYEDDYLYDYGEEEEFKEQDSIKWFLENFINKTKGALSVVKLFCEKSYDVLQSSPSVLDKSKILCEAEETHVSITNICEALDSILKRETSNFEDSIRVLSTNPDFNWVEISEEQAESYRTVISKCLEQGNILKESVTCIIDVIKLNV